MSTDPLPADAEYTDPATGKTLLPGSRQKRPRGVRIVVEFCQGQAAWLHKDAVDGPDQYGKPIVSMRTTRTKQLAWVGTPGQKEEIIQEMHAKMAIGLCPQVSYLR